MMMMKGFDGEAIAQSDPCVRTKQINYLRIKIGT